MARAGVSQAGFARFTGMTARQVNNRARGRTLAPQWAALLAPTLQDSSPEALIISLEEVEFSWREILGVPPNADTAAARRAMTRLAVRYHLDEGGRPEQTSCVNAAYGRRNARVGGGDGFQRVAA
jgi:hypothetical protein